MRGIESEIIISGIRAKVDRSLGFTAVTPELTNEEKVVFMELMNQNLKMTLTPLDSPNAPKIKIDKELDSKTPSSRLRNVLFVYWTQEGSQGEFEDFYKQKMEKFIEAVKDKLA